MTNAHSCCMVLKTADLNNAMLKLTMTLSEMLVVLRISREAQYLALRSFALRCEDSAQLLMSGEHFQPSDLVTVLKEVIGAEEAGSEFIQ